MENNLKLLSKLKSENKLSHIKLNCCPMCESKKRKLWCSPDLNGFKTVECNKCGLIYVENPLDIKSLKLYYSEYYSQTHQKSNVLNSQREKMYKQELDFLLKFKNSGSVLDVGCSGGQFLKHFKLKGFDCEGVEFGEEAASEAQKNFKVHIGEFPNIDFNKKYDIIVFRGCIEHLINPKAYFQKSLKLLNKNGIIFITATQNRNSLTCNLFKENWNMHYPHEHLIHFCSDDLINYFSDKGLKSFSEGNIYLESPYANPKKDLELVLDKIKSPSKDIKCPPFFDNMMTLVLNF